MRVFHQRASSLPSRLPNPRRHPRARTMTKALLPDMFASLNHLHKDVFQLVLLAAELGDHHRRVGQLPEKLRLSHGGVADRNLPGTTTVAWTARDPADPW